MIGINERIKERLRNSEYWIEGRTKDNGKAISPLKCPGCGKAEAWAYSESPRAIICNRKNKCGYQIKITELFPDLYINIEREYPPTRTDPNLPATAYLKYRGLTDKSLKGVRCEYWENIRNTGRGGVMFRVSED